MSDSGAFRRMIRMRRLSGILGNTASGQLLTGLGIAGLLLVGALADHVRAAKAAYQVAAARRGAALMLPLEARQQTRRMLSSLVRAPTEAPDAALGRAWLALLEQVSELGALQAWREAAFRPSCWKSRRRRAPSSSTARRRASCWRACARWESWWR